MWNAKLSSLGFTFPGLQFRNVQFRPIELSEKLGLIKTILIIICWKCFKPSLPLIFSVFVQRQTYLISSCKLTLNVCQQHSFFQKCGCLSSVWKTIGEVSILLCFQPIRATGGFIQSVMAENCSNLEARILKIERRKAWFYWASWGKMLLCVCVCVWRSSDIFPPHLVKQPRWFRRKSRVKINQRKVKYINTKILWRPRPVESWVVVLHSIIISVQLEPFTLCHPSVPWI